MSGIEIGNKIINGGSVPKIRSGAALPATGSVANEIFLLTATNTFYYWNGAAWVATGGGGGGSVTSSGMTVGNIPRATAAQNIEDSVIRQVGTNIEVSGQLSTLTNSFTTGRLISNGAAPVIAIGPGLGAGGVAIAGNDMCGVITLTVGGAPVANAIACTVTYNTAYAAIPRVLISFAGGTNTTFQAQAIFSPPSAANTLFQLFTSNSVAGLGGAVINFFYLVVQ